VFLKRCSHRKCGKDHVYCQLVESHRTPRGSRHRVVAYLGELSKGERRGWARLAATLDNKATSKARQVGTPRSGPDVPARQMFLFGAPRDHDQDRLGPDGDPVPETVEVKTKGVHVERTRDFADINVV
jgi:hypothetical protein